MYVPSTINIILTKDAILNISHYQSKHRVLLSTHSFSLGEYEVTSRLKPCCSVKLVQCVSEKAYFVQRPEAKENIDHLG